MPAGTYNLCFKVANISSYSQCFTVVITEPKDLALYSAVNKINNTITLTLNGGSTYHVTLNGTTTTTTNSTLTLALTKGNNDLIVTTDKPCQGTIEQHINTSNNLTAYPNPFSGSLGVNLGSDNVQQASVQVYTTSGTKVYSKQFNNQSGTIQMDLSSLTSGMYIMTLVTDNAENTFKIVKQ